MIKLRILTMNLAGVGLDWFGLRRKILIEGIQSLRADIVFLQETTIVHEKMYNQAQDIADGINIPFIHFAPYGNPREYTSLNLGGVAILSRWPFNFVQNRKLPPSSKDKFGSRVGIMSKITVNEREVVLGTTHLSWRVSESNLRETQAGEFLKMFSSEEKKQMIFGGDFNATPDEQSIRNISTRYNDTFATINDGPGFTWSTENTSTRSGPDRRIDYIFCSNDLQVSDSSVVLCEKNPIFPSDHFGVLSEIIIS